MLHLKAKQRDTRHLNDEKAIHHPVCGITASRVLIPFINIHVCLSELILEKSPNIVRKKLM